MRKVTRYSDLFQIQEKAIQKWMEYDFMGFWEMYGGSSGLMDYRLGVLGELVCLENRADTGDLSSLGYTGRFCEQLFEFVEQKEGVYKAVLIRDNDGGTVFYSKVGTLDSQSEEYLKSKAREGH